MRNICQIYTVLTGLILLISPRSASSETVYSVAILGQVGGEGEDGVAKINNLGQVAWTGLVGSTGHAMLYTPGSGTVDLGTLGGTNSVVNGLNDLGQVVGYSQVSNGDRGFLYSGGQMQDLYAAGGMSVADGINNKGQIVGESDGNSNFHVIVATNGVFADLTNTPGGPPAVSARESINAAGMIVGNTGLQGPAGWLYNPGNSTTLPSTIRGSLDVPAGINSSGLVAGTVRTSGYYAAVYNPMTGITSSLGVPTGPSESAAFGLNDNGDVVGYGSYQNSGFAFLYTNSGGWVDLNTLIAPNSGIDLLQATGINNQGQIVGYGSDIHGNSEIFLLTPTVVPEPSSIAMSAIGFLVLAMGLRYWKS